MISIMIVFGLFNSPACYEIRRLIILMGVIEESKKSQPALEMHGIIVELSKCSLLQSILTRTSKKSSCFSKFSFYPFLTLSSLLQCLTLVGFQHIIIFKKWDHCFAKFSFRYLLVGEVDRREEEHPAMTQDS